MRSALWLQGALVGRDDIVDELATAARHARDGMGGVVLLTGEAGIGKTSVARAVARLVRDEMAVSWGRASADRAAPPFWPWQDVLAGDYRSFAPDGDGARDAPAGAQRFELLNQLRDQIVTRARGQPRLHFIEDLQWADVASVLLLVQVGAVIDDAPLHVVATLRTGEPTSRALDEALVELRRTARSLTVPPFGDRDVATLLQAAGLDANPTTTALVRERTGGNPLFVTELLRTVAAGKRAADFDREVAGRVPERVGELVQHRLGRLPAAVAKTIAVASVIGSEGDSRAVAQVLGVPVESVIDLLEQARASRLLDAAAPGHWRFGHALMRDAVYASIAPTERARHHAAVLEALAASRATPAPVLAHHALAAQPLFDADRAAALAAQAGDAALAQHAYEEAVGWFERALAAAPSRTADRWRAELSVRSGEALRQMGEIERAREAFLAAAEIADDPALLTRAALGYADSSTDLGIAYRSDDPTTVLLHERALAAQPALDSVTTVLLEARLASLLYFSDDPHRARALAQTALERAHRLDDCHALGAAGAVTHDAFVVGQAPLDEQLSGSRRLLEWAKRDSSTSARLTAHRARVIDLMAAADFAGIDAEIAAFRRLAEPLRAPGYLWWLELWAAMRALVEGHLDEVEERAASAYGVGERSFPTLAFMNLSFQLFFLRREQGRFAEMEHAARDFVASYPDIPAMRVGLTFLLAEVGQLDEARGRLAGIVEGELASLRDRNWPASWFQLARVASLVGDREVAEALLEEHMRPSERCVMVSVATVCLGATDLAVGWLLHTMGEFEAAGDRYRAAAALNARIGARSWLAQTRADQARLALDRGDHETARAFVESAADIANNIGLRSIEPLLASLRDRLDARAVGEGEAVFRRNGSVWELAYGGRRAQVAHSRGLTDIAVLLARAGQALSVLELVDDAIASSATARGAEVFDERARREIRARLHELEAEIDHAESAGDGERAALAREQRQQLAEIVARGLGLGGRSRRLGDPAERVRKTISTRIRRSIAHVALAHPELGRHLERSIDTGAFCAYRPAEPVHWKL